MRPEPFDLFIRYHLGLDGDLQSRFYNLGSLCREFCVPPEEMTAWLKEAGVSADISGHVDFRLAKAHGEAQGLALSGAREELAACARKAWEGYHAALSTYDPTRFRDGINWNDVWGDGEG
ncbi:MAG: hypothetical protein ABIK09_21310 [Pseudomonadota bacterium]